MSSRQLRRAAARQAFKQASQAPHPEAPPAAPRSRAEINRANAAFSTGPKTASGKAAASRNSFKHGLYSTQVATKHEDAAELDALKADLRAQNQPVNDAEEILINEMAEQFWRIKRARLFEANALDCPEPQFEFLAVSQRLMSSAERGFHRSLAALRQLQKSRGFVPQNLPLETPAQEIAEAVGRPALIHFAPPDSAVSYAPHDKLIEPKIADLSG